MKITSVKLERLSDGLRAITVGLAVTDAEALEGMSPEADAMVLAAYARGLGSASVLMPEIGVAQSLKVGDQVELSGTGNLDGKYEVTGTTDAPEPAKRGRRRANPLGEVVEAPTFTPGTATTLSEPAPPRRRARPSVSTEQPTAGSLNAEPSAGAPSEPATRRRRAADPTMKTASLTGLGSSNGSANDDKITDMDLGRGASEAARVLTPIVVQGILKEFGVPHVGKLEGANRRKFLDTLSERVKAGK